MKNKIKIIVPFFNPGDFLDNCISSVLTQDYDNYEVLFIDDCSTDNSYSKIPSCIYKTDSENKPILDENGECIIEIPELRELKEKEGKLTVEAIADSVYFKLYEANAEFKNSVEVSMAKMPVTQESVPKMEIKLEGLTQEKPKKLKDRDVRVRPKDIKENEPIAESKDDWTPLKKDATEDGKLNSFQNYLKKKQTTSEV